MNKFVLFVCAAVILSCANARPDLSLGYHYNQGHSSGGAAFLQAPGSIGSSYSPVASGNSYFASQPSVSSNGNSGFAASTQVGVSEGYGGYGSTYNSVPGSGFISGFGGNTQINSGSFQQTAQQIEEHRTFQAPIVTKHFYVHSAPSDDDQQEIVRHIQIGQPQKNYHVVFIDTPSSNFAKAKIIADVAPTEDKTAIYVLSKKHNALDVTAEVNTPAVVNNKPEVFFIKYKTPEEAIQAQHSIQAQYDSLGGSSDISNEGKIPVSSVIGNLESSNGGHVGGGSAGPIDVSVGGTDHYQHKVGPVPIIDTGVNTQQAYLPPNRKYRTKKQINN